MKKIKLFLLACLPLLTQAQTTDTISGPNGRYYKYYYSRWFDSCGLWNDNHTRPGHPDIPGCLYLQRFGILGDQVNSDNIFDQPIRTVAKIEYVPHPSAIKGVAVVTSNKSGDPWSWHYHGFVTDSTSTFMAPDTCVVFNVVDNEMDILGLSRWDTVTPKIYKVPWHEDSTRAGFAYLEVYETYFKTPFEVNDTFYIAGSSYNAMIDNEEFYYLHPPHFYVSFAGNPYPDDPCAVTLDEYIENMPTGYIVTWGSNKPLVTRNGGGEAWGAFFPILSYDSIFLSVMSDDTSMGAVTPQPGDVLQWVTHTITAIPKTGFKFTHWNDGNTDNPRRVRVTQDTSFTAYFAPKELYQLSLSSANPDAGSVVGGGTYYELDTVRMEAIPSSDRYAFDFWDDGNVSNPRYHVMRSDTAFAAFFKDLTAIDEADAPTTLFTLTPNPTDGRVSVEVKSDKLKDKSGVATITVCDATGREVLKQKASAPTTLLDLSELPAGTYFVTVTIGGQSGTRKLVVK